jgi:hypothetical protein
MRRAASLLTTGAAALCVAALMTGHAAAQRGGLFMGTADDDAIAYSTGPLHNIVDDLNRRLESGTAQLTFEGRSGYLRSLAEALQLPADSQLLVHSQLSLQGRKVNRANPRALYFSDRAVVGWVRDAELIEIAAHDATQGIVFYTLEQGPAAKPVLNREFRCLGCHSSGETLGVPGLMTFSVTPDLAGQGEGVIGVDHRTPISERWGGWFVTGDAGAPAHLGSRMPGAFDTDGYRSASSDIAALLAFSHQTQMTNLLTRASWEARVADPSLHGGAPLNGMQAQRVEAQMSAVAAEVVDYLLFVDEAPLPKPIAGRSPFAERMAASGPRDRKGRSLYELDLTTRLLKYPCSYLVYSPAFDALPPLVKAPIYKRMWEVLGGNARDVRYRRLSLADRRAIVDILKDTKADLPKYFSTVAK